MELFVFYLQFNQFATENYNFFFFKFVTNLRLISLCFYWSRLGLIFSLSMHTFLWFLFAIYRRTLNSCFRPLYWLLLRFSHLNSGCIQMFLLPISYFSSVLRLGLVYLSLEVGKNSLILCQDTAILFDFHLHLFVLHYNFPVRWLKPRLALLQLSIFDLDSFFLALFIEKLFPAYFKLVKCLLVLLLLSKVSVHRFKVIIFRGRFSWPRSRRFISLK